MWPAWGRRWDCPVPSLPVTAFSVWPPFPQEVKYNHKTHTLPGNGISTRNFLNSSPDLGSKFTLEWCSFSNRSLKIALLQIYFNITKLFKEIWKKWSPSPRPLSQSECTWQQKCCHHLEKATHPMTMQDFQTKLLAEEGCSANENAGSPDTTKPHVIKVWHNADEALLVSITFLSMTFNFKILCTFLSTCYMNNLNCVFTLCLSIFTQNIYFGHEKLMCGEV